MVANTEEVDATDAGQIMSTIQRALALPITDLNRKMNRNGSIIFISKKQKKAMQDLPAAV